MTEAPRESRPAGGLRVVTQRLPSARSVAVGLYLVRGSRDEGPAEGGLTHLLEHLLFKGTRSREPGRAPRGRRELAALMDRLGGGLDAWTRQECLGLEVEVLPEALAPAVGLLCDLLARPSLEGEDLEREREVIREEIRSVEDDPVELVDELWSRWSFPEHPLGRPILGTEAELDHRDADGLRRFHASRVRSGALLACAAGSVDHDELTRLFSEGLAGLPEGASPLGPPAPAPRRGVSRRCKESLEQAQLVLSLPGLAAADPRQEALGLLLLLFAQGTSSRLWQRVREEEGLAYDIGATAVDFRDGGRVLVEAAAAPDRLRPILAIVGEEMRELAHRGPSRDEVERARDHLRTATVLARQSAGDHLDALAEDLLVEGRPVSLDERLARLEAVRCEDLRELARLVFEDPRRGLVLLGPPELPELGEEDLGPVPALS